MLHDRGFRSYNLYKLLEKLFQTERRTKLVLKNCNEERRVSLLGKMAKKRRKEGKEERVEVSRSWKGQNGLTMVR